MQVDRAINIQDMRRLAMARLPKIAFDFIDGGVEDEHGLRRNEENFRRYRLLPRYLVDITTRDITATVFGKTYAMPYGICPTGVAGLWRTNADVMLAEAAAKMNVPFILSCSSTNSIEATTKAAPKNMWFQLYITRDRSIGERMIKRACDCGVDTLVITVDVPIVPKRERNMRNGFTRPLKMTLSTILDGLRRPAWLAGYLKAGGGLPLMENWAPYAKAGATPDDVADLYASQTPAPSASWKDFEHYRKTWPGKIVLKGIMDPADAIRAKQMGVDGILVSNHGGRQLDLAPTSLDMLPVIRGVVGPDMPLFIDSGARRGSDVLIARSLGANMVFGGRPTLYGVAAGATAGAVKSLSIFRQEIDINMAQMGYTSVSELGPHNLLREPGTMLERFATERGEWQSVEAIEPPKRMAAE